MKFNDKFFRDIMRDKRISVRKLAGQLGMNHHSQLSLMFAGKRRMQLDEAITLSKLLSVPLNAVIANAGFPEILQSGKRLPVIGILRGNGEVEDVPPNTERAVAPSECPDAVAAIQARTGETALTWMDRWVFFCTEKEKPNPGLVGRFCHVKIKGGKRAMGVVRLGYASGSYTVHGPYTAENATIEWAAPVCGTRM